jgi:hypothetical protein
LFFKNRHISGALAELIRSTRAPTKDRLIGKIMGGNPAFRGTRVPVHLLAELCPRACARARYVAQVRAVADWNKENDYWQGIDPGLGEDMKAQFVALGLADLLH